MKKLFLSLSVAGSLLVLPFATDAATPSNLDDGVYHPLTSTAALDPVQFYVHGGHHFCWYDNAWRGPGWYWCGYGWHRGFGWGGGFGWRGWSGGHGGGSHGGHGGFHGGGHGTGHDNGHSGGHGGGEHHH